MSPGLQEEVRVALRAVFQDMQQRVAVLSEALEAERIALDENDNRALDKAGSLKQSMMQQLEQLDAERQQLASQLGDSAATLEADWTQVLHGLRECQLFNLRNGNAVSQRLLQVRRALSILTGQTGDSALYGQSGALHINLQSRVFAEV